jgi:hypothetical protein
LEKWRAQGDDLRTFFSEFLSILRTCKDALVSRGYPCLRLAVKSVAREFVKQFGEVHSKEEAPMCPGWTTGLTDIDYPLHDKTIVVKRCGRIWLGRKKINFSQVFAGQAVGIKEVHDDIWLVSFMHYDLGYFDLETRVLEPFGPKVLPMS